MTILHAHFEEVQRRPSAADRALADLASRQQRAGAWEGEVVWCGMIAAQMAIARTIIGRQHTGPTRERSWCDGVRTYLVRQQNPDGGWGLHPLSPSTLYVTTLSYVALRLLGEAADGAAAGPALGWMRRHQDG